MKSAFANVTLTGRDLTVEQLVAVARDEAPVALGAAVPALLDKSRAALELKLERGEVIYGVNTGFGANVKFLIPADEVCAHQEYLLHSLTCGVGDPLAPEIVRGAMLLRANALSNGFSAVRPILVERLIELLNAVITPVVPRYGSVGSSGDLIPSAYIARTLIGLGRVDYAGQRLDAAEALRRAGISPVSLEPKEGLALVNGTTVMTSVAALVADQADYLARLAIASVALCGEVLKAANDSFEEAIQKVKGHPGQVEVARLLRAYSSGGSMVDDLGAMREEIRQSRPGSSSAIELEESIQSPYSLRCAPQGLGPSLESVAQAREVIVREMNSVNDNPIIDPNDGRVYHSGNFYGGHIARAMDGLKLDLANIVNWAHALMAMLMDPRFSNGLPPNLSLRPGVNSGFKGLQLVQTSLVVACRQMCGPSTIHTVPTEQYNQDIVSLGLHSATAAMDMAVLVRNGLSILVLALCQAADLRGVADGSESLGVVTDRLYRRVRGISPMLENDRALDGEIAALSGVFATRGVDLSAPEQAVAD